MAWPSESNHFDLAFKEGTRANPLCAIYQTKDYTIFLFFAKRTYGPEWLTHDFLAIGIHEAKSKNIWEAFMTPKLTSTRIGTSKEVLKILFYLPNLVSHQFGINQTMPNLTTLKMIIFDG